MDHLFIVSSLAAIACILVAGVFLAFSDFIMRALDRASDRAGIEAMQQINREVFRIIFMTLLIGMAVLAPLLAVSAFVFDAGGATRPLIIAGVVYTVGVFGVTMIFNVPMNKHLDALDAISNQAKEYWDAKYQRHWTAWNHVRTLAALVAGIAFYVAAMRLISA